MVTLVESTKSETKHDNVKEQLGTLVDDRMPYSDLGKIELNPPIVSV